MKCLTHDIRPFALADLRAISSPDSYRDCSCFRIVYQLTVSECRSKEAYAYRHCR